MHAMPDRPDDGPALDAALIAHAQAVAREQIARLRRGRKLTQSEAGEKVGWPQDYWSRVETGGVELRLEHLLGVQRALELDTIESLFGTLPSKLAARGADR
jgi:transcriptional regulator with XRE-family HTH domain